MVKVQERGLLCGIKGIVEKKQDTKKAIVKF